MSMHKRYDKDFKAKVALEALRGEKTIQEIAAASGEQSSGADQIAKGVTQVDIVAQQNASSSEELAAMRSVLARFRVGGEKVAEAEARREPTDEDSIME